MNNDFYLAGKEQEYKNFRRNMIGSCIDYTYFARDDNYDDQNPIHNAFDFGHVAALEKIKYEFSVLLQLFNENQINSDELTSKIDALLNERINITYCKSINTNRAREMKVKILSNKLRISDDM